jgi:hypothetical protein
LIFSSLELLASGMVVVAANVLLLYRVSHGNSRINVLLLHRVSFGNPRIKPQKHAQNMWPDHFYASAFVHSFCQPLFIVFISPYS